MRIVAFERNIFVFHSEGSAVRIVAFRVDSGVSSEDSAETDGDFRVLCEQHFVGDGLFLVIMTGENVLRLSCVACCVSVE